MRVDFCGSLRFRPNTECALGVFLGVKSEKCVSDSKQLVLSKGGETNKTETATTRAQSRRITSTLRLEVARSEIEVSAFCPLPLRVVSPFAYLALKLLRLMNVRQPRFRPESSCLYKKFAIQKSRKNRKPENFKLFFPPGFEDVQSRKKLQMSTIFLRLSRAPCRDLATYQNSGKSEDTSKSKIKIQSHENL